LQDTALALRFIHDEVLRRLNSGQWPVDIIEANISLPPWLASKTHLREAYGTVGFIVRDVLRRYAGWWSGQPSALFSTNRRAFAEDIASICGGNALTAKARLLAATGEYERALALAEIAYNSNPLDWKARLLYAEVLECLASFQTSFVARNFLLASARDVMGPP
jgi:alkyl sulfatase BDS1-like metallo-beta-lactamase superfamily hydrolase